MAVVIKGAMSVKYNGLLKQKQLAGEWAVLYDVTSTSRKSPIIELFWEASEVSPTHVLVLENLKFPDKSYQGQDSAHFNVSIKKEKYQFQCNSLRDKEDWVQSLCHVSSELWTQRASSLPAYDSSEASTVAMNDNYLYDSCVKDQQFKVSVCPTRASTVNKLQGNYILSPAQDALLLMDTDNSKNIHEWPYRQIRKYGRTRLIFKMEVGRKCSTGEGEFEFFTPDGSSLVDCITVYMQQARVGSAGDLNSPDKGPESLSPQLPPRRDFRSKANASPDSDSDSDPSEAVADRKVSDKERKSQEKMAAKLKKQQEKEAKDRKEREKKQNESKGKGRPSAAVAQVSNYDEAEVEQKAPASLPPRPHAKRTPIPEPPGDSVAYSHSQGPPRDEWKKRTRDEHDPSRFAKGMSPHSPADTGEEDTYDRLGNFSKPAAAASEPENVYGMASAKQTVPPCRPPRVVEDTYENTVPALARKKAARQAGDGDYADVL